MPMLTSNLTITPNYLCRNQTLNLTHAPTNSDKIRAWDMHSEKVALSVLRVHMNLSAGARLSEL